ncbi:hypothetical protein BJ742DRAFT_773757 [Cladochytrium replicatum]|nr:hypothetical protein BJ742DRAFT_773757 [Cladochytrium replicatum]
MDHRNPYSAAALSASSSLRDPSALSMSNHTQSIRARLNKKHKLTCCSLTQLQTRILLLLSPILLLSLARADAIPPRLAPPPQTSLADSSSRSRLRALTDIAAEILSGVIARVHPDRPDDGLTFDSENPWWGPPSSDNSPAQQLAAPPSSSHDPPIIFDRSVDIPAAAPDPRFGYNIVRVVRRNPQAGGSAAATTTGPPANSPSPSPPQLTSPVPSPARTTSRPSVTTAQRSPAPSPSPDDEDDTASTQFTNNGRPTSTATGTATRSTATSTTGAEEANTPASSTGISTGTIIAIVIAGIAAVTIAGMAIWVFRKFTLRPSNEHKSRLDSTYSAHPPNPKAVFSERPVSGASFGSGSNQFRPPTPVISAPTPVISVAALPPVASNAQQYPAYGYVVEGHAAPASYAMAVPPPFAYAAAPTTVQPQMARDGYYVYYDESDGGQGAPVGRLR